MMMDGGSMMGMMIFMFLFGLLLIFAVVLIVVAVAKWLWGSMPSAMHTRENALEVLKTRYAKGEIGREEFETIRRDIEK
jgi:putative membrane protein